MKKRIILLLMMGILLSGCSVQPSKIGKGQANDIGERMTYFKDHRSDLCFGAIASKRQGTISQKGIGLTNVPCSKVKHLIVN